METGGRCLIMADPVGPWQETETTLYSNFLQLKNNLKNMQKKKKVKQPDKTMLSYAFIPFFL